jgi:hypothetical protein
MRFLALFLASFLVLGLPLAGGSALAQEDREAARAEFERGRSAFEAGAFREALDHFQEAYRLAPHPNVRVNIANCYDQLDRPIEALVHFEHFLTEADRPPPAQRREVESAIARLRQRVGTLTLQITPDGAQITIDGTETRRAPVAEPVRVVAGSHTVEVQLDGYRTERQTVVVEGGGTARLALRLQRADTAVASAGTTGATTASTTGATTASTGTTSTSTTATTGTTGTVTTSTATTATTGTATTTTGTETRATTGSETGTTGTGTTEASGGENEPGGDTGAGGGLRITTPVIITGAVTGAALLGTIIFGALALSANGSFENAVSRTMDGMLSSAEQEQARLEGEGAASDARTFAIVTDVMLITTIVGAGVTTALFIIAQGESDQEDTVALVPVLTPNAGGLFATGRF